MINYEELEFEYSIEAVPNSTIRQNLYTPNQGNVTIYKILQAPDMNISFSLYESGLALYIVETPSKVINKTNREFVEDGNGDLVISDQI